MAKDKMRHLLGLLSRLKPMDGQELGIVCKSLAMTKGELLEEIALLTDVGWDEIRPGDAVDVWVEEGRLHVFDGGLLGRPLRLSAAERFALKLGSERLAAQGLMKVIPELESALSKLETLSDASLDHPFQQAVAVRPARESLEQQLALLHQGIHGRQELEFWYFSVSSDCQSQRRVLPFSLFQKSHSWYLDAYDVDKKGWRVFAVDRVENLEVLKGSNSKEPLLTHEEEERHHQSEEAKRAWKDVREDSYERGDILLFGEAGRRAEEAAWPDLKRRVNEEVGSNRSEWEWSPEMLSLPSMVHVLCPILEEAKVLGPPSLRDALKEQLELVLAASRKA
jgi:predicted DNA-binding transcriptional regulator YafY